MISIQKMIETQRDSLFFQRDIDESATKKMKVPAGARVVLC